MSKISAYFTTRTGHFRDCWAHARRHRVVAVILALGSIYVAYTTWGPLVRFPDWAKPDSLPRVPLPWAAVAILAAILFVVVEGSYRLHHQATFSEPDVLARLPVYRQDVKIELLAVCTGTTLSTTTTVFLLVKTWAERNLNIIGLEVRVTTNEGVYDGRILKDLSEWILSEEFHDPRFSSANRRETNMESADLSLLKEIENGLFSEGHHPAKWVACVIKPNWLADKQIQKIRVKFRDKEGIAKSEIFDQWPETSFRVFDIAFRQP